MRFIYGFMLGVLASVIAAILYLAFGGGGYLLELSPRYHDMAATITALKEAKEQRDQLAARLETLAGAFDALTRRFNDLQEPGRHSAEPPAAPEKPPEPAAPQHRGDSAAPSGSSTP
jgi:hypothetical protein